VIEDNVTSLEAHKLADSIIADWVAQQSGEETNHSGTFVAQLESQKKEEFRAIVAQGQKIARDRWQRMGKK